MKITDQAWPEEGFPALDEHEISQLMWILGAFFPSIASLEMDHEGQLIAWLGHGAGQQPREVVLQLQVLGEFRGVNPVTATMPEVKP